MTITKRFSAIILALFMAVSVVMVTRASTAMAATGYPYGYTVTEQNTNTRTRDKKTSSSVRNAYASGLPDVRVAVYAVRPNGTSFNARSNSKNKSKHLVDKIPISDSCVLTQRESGHVKAWPLFPCPRLMPDKSASV